MINIKKLNEALQNFLNEELNNSIKDSIKENIILFIKDYGFEDYFTDYDLQDIEQQLADQYGYKLYGEDGSNCLVINVKGRPNISLEVTPEMQQEIDLKIDGLVDFLREQYPNFVIVGRMGGYWGLSNFIENINISEQGILKLQNKVEEIVQDLIDNKEYTEQEVKEDMYDVIHNNKDELIDILIQDVNNFEIVNSYLQDLKDIEESINDVEKQLNDPKTYK